MIGTTAPTGLSGPHGSGRYWFRWSAYGRDDVRTNYFPTPEEAAERLRHWLARGAGRDGRITMHRDVRWLL